MSQTYNLPTSPASFEPLWDPYDFSWAQEASSSPSITEDAVSVSRILAVQSYVAKIHNQDIQGPVRRTKDRRKIHKEAEQKRRDRTKAFRAKMMRRLGLHPTKCTKAEEEEQSE